MEVRYINKPDEIFFSNTFNLSSNTEIIFCNENIGCDSDFLELFEVKIKNKWVLMKDAFKNHDLITDNHNIYFFEPINKIDKKRGYCL